MDKFEYRIKTEQMLDYMNTRSYKKAMEIADSIDWRKVRNAAMLCSVSEVYEYNNEYQKSRDILFIAYDKSPGSRKIIYRLGALALRLGDVTEATDCYEEFIKLAPKDPNQFILRYKILRQQKASIDQQIEALENFKKAEYIEKWAFELAKLYQEAGRTKECIEECDDLILWFSEGEYVYRAMELKMKYKPLTAMQSEKYEQYRQEELHKPLFNSSYPQKEIKNNTNPKEESVPETEPVEAAEVKAQEETGDTKVLPISELKDTLPQRSEDVSMNEEMTPLETGQIKIEEILKEWEEKQRQNAEMIQQKQKEAELNKQKAQTLKSETVPLVPEDVRELMDRLENNEDSFEPAKQAEEDKRYTKPVEDEPEDNMGDLISSLQLEDTDDDDEFDHFEDESDGDTAYEEENDESDEYADESDEYEEEDEYESDEYEEEDEYESDEYEEEDEYELSDEYEEDEYESDEYEEDEYESDEYEEDEYESDEYEEDESDEYEEDEYEYEEDEYELEEDEFELEESEKEEPESNDEPEEAELEDEDKGLDDNLDEDLESSLELDEKSKKKPVERRRKLRSKKEEPLEIEEPSEAEIEERLNKSKGGVSFDTGFVVQGRYDLSATSEIGLKVGLTEDQKKLFSYFVPIRGLSEQIVEVLENDKRSKKRYGTSKTGNILVVGRKGTGKTVLAVDLIKAIQKQRKVKQGKVAIVTGEALNKKELSGIIAKLSGGALVIEKAGKLNTRTIRELNELMEGQTGELLIILEEQRKPLEKMLAANPEFKKKYTSRIELPIFINDELVTFGQTYAKENGYKIDDMGILALYSRIDIMQREDHAVTVSEVKEIMDAAIEHSQKANVKHLVKRVFGKSTDEGERVILTEEDFKA